jgi:hypothetical protein
MHLSSVRRAFFLPAIFTRPFGIPIETPPVILLTGPAPVLPDHFFKSKKQNRPRNSNNAQLPPNEPARKQDAEKTGFVRHFPQNLTF